MSTCIYELLILQSFAWHIVLAASESPEFMVNIREIGSSIAGENYTLNCSVISETALNAKIKWFLLDDGQENRHEVSNSSTRNITNTSSHSLLSFTPLYQSHSGKTLEQESLKCFEITVMGMDCLHVQKQLHIIECIIIASAFLQSHKSLFKSQVLLLK